MLSDAQWGELEPLIEAFRPKAKTPPKELRRTIPASSGDIRTGRSGAPSPKS